MTVYKVLAEEIDGSELANATEVLLSSVNTVYTPTTASGPKPANTAIEAQTAITNAQAINNTYFASATAQASTTSTSFVVDTAMSIVPAVGTWAIWYTGDVETTGVNTQGDVEMFVDGVGVGETLRSAQNTTNILGLITLSTATVQTTISFVERYTFNGSQTLTIRYRVNPATAGAGSIQINARTLLLMQTGLT